jgi:hypothetical protein
MPVILPSHANHLTGIFFSYDNLLKFFLILYEKKEEYRRVITVAAVACQTIIFPPRKTAPANLEGMRQSRLSDQPGGSPPMR